jgi:hypothetical protein
MLENECKSAISEDDVRLVIATGTVIEAYPNTQPYPSYLMLGGQNSRPLHVVATDNLAGKFTLVITVYEPNPGEWDAELKVRQP